MRAFGEAYASSDFILISCGCWHCLRSDETAVNIPPNSSLESFNSWGDFARKFRGRQENAFVDQVSILRIDLIYFYFVSMPP